MDAQSVLEELCSEGLISELEEEQIEDRAESAFTLFQTNRTTDHSQNVERSLPIIGQRTPTTKAVVKKVKHRFYGCPAGGT